MLYLRELSVNDGREVYEMLQGITDGENGVSNPVQGMAYEDFPVWLEGKAEARRRLGQSLDYAPSLLYWLYDGETPVGQGKIRPRLTEELRREGGTLGYAIARPYRGRGYGTALLGLLIAKARELGVEDLLATVLLDNIPSRRICEANGGVLGEEGEKDAYYWFS